MSLYALPMALTHDEHLAVLRAVGEITRSRIVALLAEAELTVTDLTDILRQSQPRISRHLKLLVDAGVVTKHREGSWAFFTLASGPARPLVDTIIASVDRFDPVVAVDRERLDAVRTRRSRAAQAYFADIAERWDEERSLHAPDASVETAIVDVLADRRAAHVLDLGTGTGRMLHLLTEAGHGAERAIGLDNNHSMLAVARSHLEQAERRGIELRHADVYRPPFPPHSFDLVVLHQVLHFLDDPARAVGEAAAVVAPGGRLVVVDFAPHGFEFLRDEHAHRRLGFRDETIAGWFESSGLVPHPPRTVAPPADADGGLTVSIWMAAAPDTVRAERDEQLAGASS